MIEHAVIFDMDGVITDSEPLYAQAINVVLRQEGLTPTDDDHRAVMGRSLRYTWLFLIDRFNLAGDVDDWIPIYDDAVSEVLGANAVAAEGLQWLLAGLKERGVRIGLATGSTTKWADIILNRLGVADAFEAIATADMVAATKPAPDLYLLSAEKLGIPPERCLTLDDTPSGIASAKAAGMIAVAVRTESTAGMGVSAADYAIDRLTDFDFAWLANPGSRRESG